MNCSIRSHFLPPDDCVYTTFRIRGIRYNRPGGQTMFQLLTITVIDTPETRIRLGTSLNPNAIQEGADVYFDCLIRAEPSVHKVEWRHQVRSKKMTKKPNKS